MATRKMNSTILGIIGILVVVVWLLGPVTQAMAETMKYKFLGHVTKREDIPVGDLEGHLVGLAVIDGVAVFENGEMAPFKGIVFFDVIKGKGSFDKYTIITFGDGSRITTKLRGTTGVTSGEAASSAALTGEIIKGTGRFDGIKGTATSSLKILPPEKGELGGKRIGEATITYTLPSK